MAGFKLTGSRVVIADGCRTPFLRASTGYNDLMAYQLGAMAVSALVDRSRIDPGQVDRVIFGTVLSEPKTSNLSREVALASGLPLGIPAYTVTAACTSANVAISNGFEAIAAGMADVVVAGGAELLSDVPIRLGRKVRQRLMGAAKAKGIGGMLKLLSGLQLADLKPDAPAIAEFTTDLTMGDNAERLAKRYGVSRRDQDEFALSSHRRAALATSQDYLADQIVTAFVPPSCQPICADNGIRGDSTMAKLESLPPVFDRQFGSVTAGNSSFLTDGAAAVLLLSEAKAAELGIQPLAAIRSYAMVAM
ncbi:MAG: acetyl-CoA C-acyltransferase, partial [Cyanobacteria bacterium REEB65]|nr:acetyl-CoA C-acyltransferase [Cyanobacteria bacterium REEB65]